MTSVEELPARSTGRWVTGAAFAAVAILSVAPIAAVLVSRPVLLIMLCSPIYMVHQVEEHWRDRFRRFVNAKVFGGRPAITERDVFIINVPLVWGLNLISAYAAVFVAPGAGLIAPYAMLVNGIAHIAAAGRMRTYNPGLLSAILLFLPLGISAIVAVGSLRSTSFFAHLLALGGSVVVHAAIAGHAMRRAARCRVCPNGS